MTIKTYWTLSKDESAKHSHAAFAQLEATTSACKYLKEKTGCDKVYFTSGGSSFIAFKEKSDDKRLRKTGVVRHDSHWLYTPKVKTDWNEFCIEAEKIKRSSVSFDEYCKSLWIDAVRSVVGSIGGSFTITETSFGFIGGTIVMMVPWGDDEVIKKSIIPNVFQEITAGEYIYMKQGAPIPEPA